MKISDIINTKDLQKKPPEEPKKEPPAALKSEPPSVPVTQPRNFFSEMRLTGGIKLTPSTPPTPPAPISPPVSAPASAVKRTHLNISGRASSREAYGDLVLKSRDIIRGFSRIPVRPPDLEEVCETVERAIECLETDPSSILELIERSTPEDYMPGHLANVTVLSIALSQQMGWPRPNQLAMGVGAMLHDVGMVFHRPQYMNQPRALTNEERMFLRKLPEEGLETLRNFLQGLSNDSREIITNIVTQFQERLSGQGFPNHLKGGEISREAQIIGLCDTYESLTHPRPYRRRKLSHYTLRYLIELTGDMFDGALIKALWESLSLFPPGSFVKLNTDEIGKVVGLNRKLPTRPVVQVMITAEGKKAVDERILDLAQTPGVTIQRAVDECALPLSDGGLTLELRAQKWWIK